MHILVTGLTGKLATAWKRRIPAGGPGAYEVSTLSRADGDLGETAGTDRWLEQIRARHPDVVVHTAAWTDVDACERDPELARQINATASGRIAEVCRETGTGLIFYSSDHVFPGKSPEREDGEREPVNVYGRTKVAAEDAIRDSGVEHLVVRINVPLAPPADGASFYSFLLEHLLQGEAVKIVTDQRNNPLDTDRIARWSLEAWERGERGVLHLGGGTYESRYDIARTVAKHVGAPEELILHATSRDLKQAAPRPLRGGLICARQAELFGTAPDLASILKSLPASL